MTTISPVNLRIDEAIAKLERYDQIITPTSIEANVELRWNDLSPTEAANKVLKAEIQRRCRKRGLIITTADTRQRKSFWNCTPEEIEEEILVKQNGSLRDQNRIKADRACVAFLKEKRVEFGYEVYPELFAEDIERIYAMEGCSAPGRW